MVWMRSIAGDHLSIMFFKNLKWFWFVKALPSYSGDVPLPMYPYSQMLNVWYIFLHLVNLYGKLVGKYTSPIECLGLTGNPYMCQGLNSHYFHIIGDKLINPIVGVYIPIIRIPY